ncbi:hypothetical protein ACFL60_09735 [Candidatus Omnitrophota bacterium]
MNTTNKKAFRIILIPLLLSYCFSVFAVTLTVGPCTGENCTCLKHKENFSACEHCTDTSSQSGEEFTVKINHVSSVEQKCLCNDLTALTYSSAVFVSSQKNNVTQKQRTHMENIFGDVDISSFYPAEICLSMTSSNTINALRSVQSVVIVI